MKNVFMIWKTWNSRILRLTFLGFLGTLMSISSYAQSWQIINKVVADDRAMEDNFGHSVAIFGNYAVVGAPYEDHTTGSSFQRQQNDQGAAYIYENVSGSWIQIQKIVASDGNSEDLFGYSVSISGDIIAVGAPNEDDGTSGLWKENSGSVYLFKKISGSWTQVEKIEAPDRDTEDKFGLSVSLSEDYLIVGAPYESHDASGGNNLLYSGSAYIFEYTGEEWNQGQKIVANNRNVVALFGESVSISGDFAVVGAHGESRDEMNINFLGSAGAAYIFKRISGNWVQTKKITPPQNRRQSNAKFGKSVSIFGNKIIVGAYWEDYYPVSGPVIQDAGAAYIFENINGNWTHSISVDPPSGQEYLDIFGTSVSISEEYAVVGCSNKNVNGITNSGAAYLYQKVSGNWTQIDQIIAPDKSVADFFGQAVSISESQVICGAPKEDHDEIGANNLSNSGSAYFFGACAFIGIQSPEVLYVCPGDDLTIAPILSGLNLTYEWRKVGSNTIIGTSSTYTISKAKISDGGEYEITISNSCGSDAAIVAEVIIGSPPDGPNCAQFRKGEFNTLNNIDVFPNPANSILNISTGDETIISLKLINKLGQTYIIESNRSSYQNIDLTQYNSGLYFLEVITENGRAVEKVIVQH